MPYQTYTNESDERFAAQLDAYKLGPGVSPGGSQFWAAEAAMNALGNNSMNVAQLMRTRSALHGDSMQTRMNVQSEREKKEDMDEYDSFLMESKEAYVPGDFVGNAERREDLMVKYQGNPLAAKTLSEVEQASQWGVRGKKVASENADIDFKESIRKEQEALQLGEVRRATKTSKLLDSQAEEMINADTDRRYQIIGDMNASIYRVDPVMAENLTRARARMVQNNDEEGIRNLGRIATIYNKSLLLETAFAPEIAKSEELNSRLKSRGVDISKIDSPEAEAKALSEMMVILEKEYPTKTGDEVMDRKNKMTQQNYVDSFAQTAGLRKLLNERKGIADSVAALFSKAPAKGSPEEAKWKEDMEVLLMRSADHAGFVNNSLAKKTKDMEYSDKMLDLQKKHQDILYRKIQGKAAMDRVEIAKQVVQMRREGMNDDIIADTIRIAGMTDDNMRRDPKALEKLIPEAFRIATELRDKAGDGAAPIDF